ncbi:hypothetical protein FB451DRAFT_1174432 [Mycena latifolia]|nr:hypothetical protein FB451DRAFT_1174432 [Mycena latifolia]
MSIIAIARRAGGRRQAGARDDSSVRGNLDKAYEFERKKRQEVNEEGMEIRGRVCQKRDASDGYEQAGTVEQRTKRRVAHDGYGSGVEARLGRSRGREEETEVEHGCDWGAKREGQSGTSARKTSVNYERAPICAAPSIHLPVIAALPRGRTTTRVVTNILPRRRPRAAPTAVLLRVRGTAALRAVLPRAILGGVSSGGVCFRVHVRLPVLRRRSGWLAGSGLVGQCRGSAGRGRERTEGGHSYRARQTQAKSMRDTCGLPPTSVSITGTASACGARVYACAARSLKPTRAEMQTDGGDARDGDGTALRGERNAAAGRRRVGPRPLVGRGKDERAGWLGNPNAHERG